jgi:DNA-binding transcriptional MerR regulator
MSDETVREKLYYSIGEVAGMLGVQTSAVRYWEKEFDILKPKKNRKGNRMFTPEDLRNIKIIHHLLKEKGMTIAGAKKKMSENPESVSKTMEVIDSLRKIRDMLTGLRDTM